MIFGTILENGEWSIRWEPYSSTPLKFPPPKKSIPKNTWQCVIQLIQPTMFYAILTIKYKRNRPQRDGRPWTTEDGDWGYEDHKTKYNIYFFFSLKPFFFLVFRFWKMINFMKNMILVRRGLQVRTTSFFFVPI